MKCSLIYWLKERWLRWVNKAPLDNHSWFNENCNHILNECLDDLDVVNQTNYRVSLRLKRTGEIFKFVTTPETFPHHYGNMVSKITKHGTKETYGGKYGLYGVSYATRYRLRNALKISTNIRIKT